MNNTVHLTQLTNQRSALNELIADPENRYRLSKFMLDHLLGLQNLTDYISDNLQDNGKVTLIIQKESE
jgi:hypothetical protein